MHCGAALLSVLIASGCSLDWSRVETLSSSSSSTTTGGGGGTGAGGAGAAGGRTVTSGAPAVATVTGGGGQGGAGSACLVGLSDTFPSRTASQWNLTQADDCGAFVDPNSGLVLICSASMTNTRVASAGSMGSYDFTACGVEIEVEQAAAGGTSELGLELEGAGRRYAFVVRAGSLVAERDLGNVSAASPPITFNAMAHRYWRIGGENGCVHWATSPDRAMWTEVFSQCDGPAGSLAVTLYGNAPANGSSFAFVVRAINAP